ncbi:MAG: YgiT-type zinc finger protein [Candidatus Odinarchaeota archaeon]
MSESRECPYCKGTADSEESLTYSIEDKTVANLKGWKCTQCGSILYDEESVARIERELDS